MVLVSTQIEHQRSFFNYKWYLCENSISFDFLVLIRHLLYYYLSEIIILLLSLLFNLYCNFFFNFFT